jgi:hypothetical protein
MLLLVRAAVLCAVTHQACSTGVWGGATRLVCYSWSRHMCLRQVVSRWLCESFCACAQQCQCRCVKMGVLVTFQIQWPGLPMQTERGYKLRTGSSSTPHAKHTHYSDKPSATVIAARRLPYAALLQPTQCAVCPLPPVDKSESATCTHTDGSLLSSRALADTSQQPEHTHAHTQILGRTQDTSTLAECARPFPSSMP